MRVNVRRVVVVRLAGCPHTARVGLGVESDEHVVDRAVRSGDRALLREAARVVGLAAGELSHVRAPKRPAAHAVAVARARATHGRLRVAADEFVREEHAAECCGVDVREESARDRDGGEAATRRVDQPRLAVVLQRVKLVHEYASCGKRLVDLLDRGWAGALPQLRPRGCAGRRFDPAAPERGGHGAAHTVGGSQQRCAPQ
mmetsp:Transcript_74958/g.225289  ORF Transcript_74958/g.225289 Transcript_74958/m.225289 type:complete len:201 (-) Transcript_74958:34-636(-)